MGPKARRTRSADAESTLEGVPSLAILFADVVGSTRLYESLGDDRARSLVADCLVLLSECTVRFGGLVIKTIGDEVMCTFDSADAATNAAIEMHASVTERLPTVNANTPPGFRIRIGVHFGPAIVERGDVFGDAVNVAARMAALAKGDQILTTQATVLLLSTALRRCARRFDRVAVRGKAEEIEVFEIAWQPESLTVVGRTGAAKLVGLPTSVRLTYDETTIELGSGCLPITLGRSSAADIVIDDVMISREHARIERRRGRFYLIDSSTNGTYVETDAGLRFLKREELLLCGTGRISLGRDLSEAIHLVRFVCD